MWDKFIQAATTHFRFLEAEFGLTPKPPFAIYESEKLQILAYYDAKARHELDLRVRRLADDLR
jgi:hypothetical protein